MPHDPSYGQIMIRSGSRVSMQIFYLPSQDWELPLLSIDSYTLLLTEEDLRHLRPQREQLRENSLLWNEYATAFCPSPNP